MLPSRNTIAHTKFFGNEIIGILIIITWCKKSFRDIFHDVRSFFIEVSVIAHSIKISRMTNGCGYCTPSTAFQ